MQRCFVILVACAFVLALNVQYVFAYPKAVAIITNYSDANIANSIKILRANGEPPGSERLLYPNDKIIDESGRVQFKLAPYTQLESVGNTYVIKYTPPSAVEKIRDELIDMFNSFQKSVEYYTGGVTLGAGDATDLAPQPGYDVTLISGQKVTFSWFSPDSKTFSIADENGRKVFEQDVRGLTSIEINIDSAKLKAGKQYFWSVDEQLENCKITMLDKKIGTQILSKLKEIDSAQNLSENERLLKKVAYVQLLSDTYPNKIDLYWLSAQWLLDFKATTEEDYNYQQFLLEECVSHLSDKVSGN